ncbi:TPA: hypothetical protein RQJ82_002207 [Vibrio vulnificus]|nr:hypothetical protein [Vibrio vulnificus]
MRVSWKKNKSLKPQIILEKIDSLKVVKDEQLSFSSFEYHDALVALESMIDFPSITEDLEKPSLVSAAISATAKEAVCTKDAFLKNLNDQIKVALARRENTYYLLTSLSVRNLKLRKIQVQNCTIKFYQSSFPKNFSGRREIVNKHSSKSKPESDGYIKVVVELKAKSERIAANQALKALDILRGILAIYCNDQAELIGNNWAPINKIRTGEFHSIHNESGVAYDQALWFEPNFVHSPCHVIQNHPIIVKNSKTILNRLTKFEKKYQTLLVDGLLRYVRAYDERDQNVAVLKAWGALESLAAPNESNCDSVTSRCAFLYEEYEYHKQILEHLREYRNRNVHAGQESRKAKSYGFQIQRYFKQLFMFHIGRQGNFQSIVDANRFLDSPVNQEDLIAVKARIDKVLKYRGYVA